MREVTVRVPRRAVEDVLDRLLPIVPGGVREVSTGRHVELRLRGHDIPDREAMAQAAGRWPYRLSEREVPDDWRQRRLMDYEPDVIGGRLVVRPEWAPAPGAGLIDVVDRRTVAAFGSGAHPDYSDLPRTACSNSRQRVHSPTSACGSGVLADSRGPAWLVSGGGGRHPGRERCRGGLGNAAGNGSASRELVMDLGQDAAPPQPTALPPTFPPRCMRSWPPVAWPAAPAVGVLSGFGSDEAAAVKAAYARRGTA